MKTSPRRSRRLHLQLTPRRVRWLRNGAVGVAFAGLALSAAGTADRIGFSEGMAAELGFGQPRGFQALRGRDHPVDAERARRAAEELRRRSEERIGKLDGGDGAKDDFQSLGRHVLSDDLQEAIRSVRIAPRGYGQGLDFAMPAAANAPAVRRSEKRNAPVRGAGLNGIGFASWSFQVPVGGLQNTLAGTVLGLAQGDGAVGELPPPSEERKPSGGDAGARPTGPGSPGAQPQVPPGFAEPPMPDAEVPIPAPLILFATGLAVLLGRRR